MSVGTDPRVGTEFLDYRLEALIGRGGMGVVYRAHDPRLKRDVALKLLAPEYAADAGFRERFLAETERAASLEHPNVIPIHDAGEVDGQLYLVMRLASGGDLKRALDHQSQLEPQRAIAICSQVASALDAAHAEGLVHRDVKPSNVLLDGRGHVYLADFGLSRTLADQVPELDVGHSLGTPAYVAPEQIEGRGSSSAADQYSLACVLHECLTGRPPFPRASDAAVLFAHLEEQPPHVPGLGRIFEVGLAKDPAHRFASCGELVEAARTALGIVERRHRRWPPALAGAGGALLVAALLAFLVARGDGAAGPRTTGRLIGIDPASNSIEHDLSVGNGPVAVAVAADAVWVAHGQEGTVWRVDPRSEDVELRVPARGKPVDLVVSGRRVAVANGPLESNVAVLTSPTGGGESVVSIAPPGFSLGSPRIASRSEEIWIATGDRRVGRLEPVTGMLVRPVAVPRESNEALSAPSAIAAGEREVWVLGDANEREAWLFDSRTGAFIASVPLPFAPTDIAIGAGGVWVTSQLDDTVSRIDPATRRITDTLPVGRGASSIAAGAGAVWVANAIDETLSRIDAKTLGVETVRVNGVPKDIAVAENGVWVVTERAQPSARSDTIAIGVLASCDGAFGYNGDPSFAAAELPLLERGARLRGLKPSDGVDAASIAGTRVELIPACTDDSAKTALAEARRLVEQVGVEMLIGPAQAEEAFVIREYARRRTETTFVGGTAYPQGLTLHDPAPNVFRFSPDGAQWMAALGTYAYHELGWRRVVTLGDDWHFGYHQVAGFAAGFCSLGGTIAEQVWLPLGSADMAFVGRVPRRGVDGYVLGTLPPSSLAFLARSPHLLEEGRVVGGIFMDSVLQVLERPPPVLVGAPLPVTNEAFVRSFRAAFPDLDEPAEIFTYFYYAPAEATLQALEAVDGDLSDSQGRFRAALAELELDAPHGRTSLDERHQAIAPSYVLEAAKRQSGTITWRHVLRVDDVDQTFGGYFRPDGPPLGRDTIDCKRHEPPPWAKR
jgi:DNA-binding beta-propeller fold protein YncE/ABC-type branched-subunit amino acid transport system substrate-binding protein